MPNYAFWILLGLWFVMISIITWIIIDTKRYPPIEEDFTKGNRKEQMEAQQQWKRKK